MADTLFAHLAITFGSHPENLATEALGYVLHRSPAAREALRALLRHVGVDIPENLTWATQIGGEDGARPDLVGRDMDGRQIVLIEAKFWAGLTENQPVTYLDRPGVRALVFVAPAARAGHLWGELYRRCAEKKSVTEIKSPPDAGGALVGDVGGQSLVLVSWRSLVAAMLARVEAADDRHTAEDLSQLRGLCERMDTDAFLPVTSEELTAHVYRRVVQFGAVVDDVTTKLLEMGIASTKGLRATATNGVYVRSLSLRGVGVTLRCDIHKWMKFAATPLWLSVYGSNWEQPQQARAALASLEAHRPPKMFVAGDGFPTVPLFVQVGVERDDIVRSVVEQVVQVGDLIAAIGGSAPADMPPPHVAPGDEA